MRIFTFALQQYIFVYSASQQMFQMHFILFIRLHDALPLQSVEYKCLWNWNLLNNNIFLIGKDKEFYSFYDQCFESKEGKYVYSSNLSCPVLFITFFIIWFSFVNCISMDRYTYKVCAYKKATQAEGHSSTNLGYVYISLLYSYYLSICKLNSIMQLFVVFLLITNEPNLLWIRVETHSHYSKLLAF